MFAPIRLTATSSILLMLGCIPALADDAIQFTSHPDNDRWPAWSPDGSTIAYTRDNGNSSNLYVQLVDGGEPMVRVPTSTNVLHPAWNPDSAGIFYSRLGVLWFISYPGGGTVTQVSSQSDGGHPDEAPAISTSGIIAAQSVIGNESSFSIATYPRAGGTTERRTTDPGPHRWPTWNPAGTEIAFAAGGDLKAVTLAGGAIRVLEANAADDTHPAWSPDGAWIAFASDRSGNYDIWLLPTAGGSPVQVTDDAASDLYPAWSPDGTRLVFESSRSGNPDLWIIDVSSVGVDATSWGALKRRLGP